MARPESMDCYVGSSAITEGLISEMCKRVGSQAQTTGRKQKASKGDVIGNGSFSRSAKRMCFTDLSPRWEKTAQEKRVTDILIRYTRQTFPDFLKRIYIIPFVHLNRVSYSEVSIGSRNAIKLHQPDTRMSDVRFDECQRRVHNCLMSMTEGMTGEVMFIVFSLVFDNYLNCGGKSSTDAKGRKGATERKRKSGHLSTDDEHDNLLSRQNADQSKDASFRKEDVPDPLPVLTDLDLSIFPRPRDFHQRGEFDLLIIHRRHGLLVGEIKAMGDVFEVSGDYSSVSQQHSMIRRKVQKCLKQLDKAAEMLEYLLDDVQAGIPVSKVLILPNLKKQAVRAALQSDRDLVQSFCQTFDSEHLDQALQKCIFSEQLPPMGHSVTADDDVTKELLRDWWKPLTGTLPTFIMSDKLYEVIVARFCGPATKQYVATSQRSRVEVSTLAQGVQETARCFTDAVLTPKQVAMLENPSPRVMLSGPPGTGKTLMLKLKAMEWLEQGHTVMIISLWTSSHAVSCYLDHQVREEVKSEEAERLHLVLNSKANFEDVITKLRELRRPSGTAFSSSLLLLPQSTEQEPLLSGDSGFGELADLVGDGEDGGSSHGPPTRPGQNGDPGVCDMDLDTTTLRPAAASEMSETRQASLNHNGRCQEMEGPGARQTSGTRDLTDRGQKLHVVVAEAPWFVDRLSLVLETFLGKDGFVIWVSTSSACPLPPPSRFTRFEVTQNLRCPPAVVREMMKTPAYGAFDRPRYASQDAGVLSIMPYPTDGPRVITVRHLNHRVTDVWNCEQCGEAVANFLTKELRIGGCITQHPAMSAASAAQSGAGVLPAEEDALSFSDVLISGHLPSLRDVFRSAGRQQGKSSGRMEEKGFLAGLRHGEVPYDVINNSGRMEEKGFLAGLRHGEVPYDVINTDDVNSYRKLAVPENAEGVQVAEAELVKGVEKKVVVVLGALDFPTAVPRYVDPCYDVMGCCRSQLVIVGDADSMLAEKLKKRHAVSDTTREDKPRIATTMHCTAMSCVWLHPL